MVSPHTPNPPPGSEHTPPPTAFGRPRSGGWKHTAKIVVLLAAVAWSLFFGGRWLAGYLATSLPYSVDQKIGSLAAGQLTGEAVICTNPVLVGAVDAIVQRLAGGVDDAFEPFHVKVLQDDSLNAFALPGGYMFVLTGLLEAAESPEEVAGVLGHEIGHVVHRHGMRRIAQSVWVQFIFANLFGDLGFTQLLAGQALDTVSKAFDRDQERESDRYGLDLMLKVGMRPGDFPAFFERMPTVGIPEWLSTHPHPEGRAQELRELIAEAPPVREPWTLPPLEALQAPCHAGGGE